MADARGIAEAIAALAGDGKAYARAHVRLLLDNEVTPASVENALGSLAAMKRNDLAVVFFAGHGVKTSAEADMVFLTSTVTANLQGVAQSGVGWSSVAKRLEAAKGRVLVLLDACHSGHITQAVTIPNDELAHSLTTAGRAGAVVFAAAKGRQESLESARARALRLVTPESDALVKAPGTQEHGFFTGANEPTAVEMVGYSWTSSSMTSPAA